MRDYIMVADVVRANELAIKHLLTRTNTPATVDDVAFNIGTGVSTSVNELYDLIASRCGASRVPSMSRRVLGSSRRAVWTSRRPARFYGLILRSC